MKFNPPPKKNTKVYVKLSDGQSIQGVFRGDIVEGWQHFNGKFYEECKGRNTCEACKRGEKASFRFAVNFVTKEDGKYVSRVFSQGRRAYTALGSLHGKFNLEKTLVEITRNGSGQQDTSYLFMPLPDKLNEAEIAKVPLQPLKDEPEGVTVDTGPEFNQEPPF